MILLSLLLGLTAVFGPMTAGAESAGLTETNEETGYSLLIEDTAGLLDAEETAEVAETMRPILQYASAGFLTWPEDGGDRTAGATKAQRWGDRVFGPNTRFTVFIIDMETRHLDIYASRPLARVLTAAEENSITDNVYRYATRGEYGECAKETFSQIEKVLRGEKIATPMKYISNALLALIAAVLAAYLLISAWIRGEQAVSMPDVVRSAAAGAATVVLGRKLTKVVHHESSSGGGHGGGGSSGGGGGGGSSGGHGF